MNRRDFAKRFGAAVAGYGSAMGQTQEGGGAPTLYYVDGYHGGSRGHMPPGSWRDILNALRVRPEWKISFDIEPASWTDLRRDDPQAYREIQRMLEDKAVGARLEIVNGTFSQPFGWALGGESNIRQLIRGREVIREHFPGAVIETYAVQEPCWSSCLPQLLRSLGFTGAVLKDPGTAWGGYTAGFDAEVVEWVGPDGTSIPAVPRYACEDLLRVWETESVTGSAAFSRKALEHGIVHPAGNCFQDLGWAAKPKVSGEHIRFVTWREYLKQVAGKPQKQWRFSQEDILTTLPWGERTLQTLAQQVRAAENRLLTAEKMASMAAALHGTSFPSDRLRRAWDQLLWAEHHDAWITATTRTGRQAWAFQVASETMEAEELGNEIIAASAEAMSRGVEKAPGTPLGPQWLRVFNTVAAERDELVEMNWAGDIGTRRARVFDAGGRELPCQFVRPRIYNSRQGNRPRSGAASAAGIPSYAAGESMNAATVLFRARVPATGYASFRIEPLYDDSAPAAVPGATAHTQTDGTVLLETDLYRVRIDPAKGGAITSLLVKDGNREFFDATSGRLFNEYRGYFISEKKWSSSTETPASVVIAERGPVRVRVVVSGQIGGRRFQTTISLVQGQRRIDFNARFTYDQETWIGDPWDIKPENRRSERRRSHHDGRWKLQAFFPIPFKNQAIYKNAAFDVCKSRNQDTYFQRWDEIKHNIVLNWVDVVDEQQKQGLAVFSDHTTAYTHGPDHPLALVMGWGWEGGFWWAKCPLKGTQQVSYAILPHGGKWDEAQLSGENHRWNEPLLAQIMNGESGGTAERSLVSVSGGGIEVPTLLMDGRQLLVRLFNAEGDGAERTVSLGAKPVRVELVELDGRVIRQLRLRRAASGRYEVTVALPRFGIRTLRCEMGSTKG